MRPDVFDDQILNSYLKFLLFETFQNPTVHI